MFAAFINEGRPDRDIPDVLRPMEDNANGLRMAANPFFANVTRLAAAGGTRFVLVDMEQAAGKTQAENIHAQRRRLPYFVNVDPDDVYDWSVDSRGLEWVVVHGTDFRRQGFGIAGENSETITCWTRKDWRRWRKVYTADATGRGTPRSVWLEDGGGTHTLGEVPLVPFHFEAVDLMTGLAATDDVLSLVLRIFRRDSELDKMLYDRAVPLLVVNGVDEKHWESFAAASSNALISSDRDGVDARYAEPQGTSFQALSEAISRDETSVREIALRMVRPATAVGESADAKKIDQRQLDTQLANYARECAARESQCWRLAARWIGLDAEGIAAPYRENYDVEEATSVIVDTLLELSSRRIISKAAVLRADAVKKALPKDFDEKDNARELTDEAREEGVGTSLTALLRGVKDTGDAS